MVVRDFHLTNTLTLFLLAVGGQGLLERRFVTAGLSRQADRAAREAIVNVQSSFTVLYCKVQASNHSTANPHATFFCDLIDVHVNPVLAVACFALPKLWLDVV